MLSINGSRLLNIFDIVPTKFTVQTAVQYNRRLFYRLLNNRGVASLIDVISHTLITLFCLH